MKLFLIYKYIRIQ